MHFTRWFTMPVLVRSHTIHGHVGLFLILNLLRLLFPADSSTSTNLHANLSTPDSSQAIRNRFSRHFQPSFPYYRSSDAAIRFLNIAESRAKDHGKRFAEPDRHLIGKPGQNLFTPAIWSTVRTTENEPQSVKSDADGSRHSTPSSSSGVDRTEFNAKSIAANGKDLSGTQQQIELNLIRNWYEKASLSIWENTTGHKMEAKDEDGVTPEHRSLKRLNTEVLIAAPSSSTPTAPSVDPERRVSVAEALLSRHKISGTESAAIVVKRLSGAIKKRHLPTAKDKGDELLMRITDGIDSIWSSRMDGGSEEQKRTLVSETNSVYDEHGAISPDKGQGSLKDRGHVGAIMGVSKSSIITSSYPPHIPGSNEIQHGKAFDEFQPINEESFALNDSSAVDANKTNDHLSSSWSYRTGFGWIKGNQNAFIDPYNNNKRNRLFNSSPYLQQVLESVTLLNSAETDTFVRSVSDKSNTTTSTRLIRYDINTSEKLDDQGANISKITADNEDPFAFKSTKPLELSHRKIVPLTDHHTYQNTTSMLLNRTNSTVAQETEARCSTDGVIDINSNNMTRKGSPKCNELRKYCFSKSKSFLEIRAWKFTFQSSNFIWCFVFAAALGYSILGFLLATRKSNTSQSQDYLVRINSLLLLLSLCHVVSCILLGFWPDEFHGSLSINILFATSRLSCMVSFLWHCLYIYRIFTMFRRCFYSKLCFLLLGISVFLILLDVLLKAFLPNCSSAEGLLTEAPDLLFIALFVTVCSLYFIFFRRKARSASSYWIESQLDADSKETVYNITRLVKHGLRLTDICSVLGLGILMVNTCDIVFRFIGRSEPIQIMLTSALLNLISAANCFALGLSCRQFLAIDGSRYGLKGSESSYAVSSPRDSAAFTRSSMNLSREKTLDDISSFLNLEPVNFLTSSRFRSRTLSRSDVRSSDPRTRNAETLPLNSRNSDGILIQRSLENADHSLVRHGDDRDSKKRSMLFNDNGFIRFRKETDPEEPSIWSNMNTAADEADSSNGQDPMEGISSVGQPPEISHPDVRTGIPVDIEGLSTTIGSESRSMEDSGSSTPKCSRSCRNSSSHLPDLFSYRLPLIHLQESIDRALNDLALKPIDTDSIIEV